jgi:predicted ATPase/DNA-binding SARP family transcriptional activator
MSEMLTYQLRLLGPIQVGRFREDQSRTAEEQIGGNPNEVPPRFRSRRTMAMLGYLVIEQRPIARDRLTALFWPDWSPSRARANLRRDLHNLTQILPGCWELNRRSVSFVHSENVTIDIYQLEQLVASEQWPAAAELLGGDFLEGLFLENNPEFENWLLAERARWQGVTEVVLRQVIEGYMRRGQYADALLHSRKLLQLAPWDEDAHQQIMRLLTWTGQRSAALRQFENCKQALKEELDVEPAPKTVALHQKIQDGKLDLPPQTPPFLTEERARHRSERAPFVGREDELERLDGFIDTALAGQGNVVFVSGGPGRGKTALLETFADRAMKKYPTLLVASGKCNAYSGIGDLYLPFRDVMAMLTGELEGRWDAGSITRDHARRLWVSFPIVVQILLDFGPHLLDVLVSGAALLSRSMCAGQEYAPWLPRLREQVKLAATGTVDLEQGQLFQQITTVLHTIAQERPLLLILDDMQWADAASISLLFHLGRRLAGTNSKLLIACAYRPEEVVLGRNGQRHPLAKVLSEFKRTLGDIWVHLDRASESKDRKFVDALLDIEPNRIEESFRTALFERTGGHPLFTVEMLRAMQERGDLFRDEDGAWIADPTLDWHVLPARVEAVIAERIDRLDPELRDILTIASVEGELFTAQVVVEVQKVSERTTLQRLSHYLERQHRLVREREEVYTGNRRLSRYQFGHVLFQDYLYEHLSQGERRLLHGDVAAALEKLYEGKLDEMAVQLAHHYHRASEYSYAFHYYGLAGERAARLYENRDAIKHFTLAIQFAESVSPDPMSLAQLYRGRGLAYGTVGEFEWALADYKLALQLAGVTGEQDFAWRTYLDLGRLWAARDHDQAKDYFETALDLARQQNKPILLATSLNWMGNWHTNNEDPKRAVAYHHQALTIFEELGDSQNLANTLDLLGIANLLAGDLNISAEYYDRAIELSQELNDRPRLASSIMGSATTVSALAWLTLVPAPVARDPVADVQEALQIACELSLASENSWGHYSLGVLKTVQGEFDPALKHLQTCLRYSADIDHREWTVTGHYALGFLYSELFAVEQALSHLETGLDLAGEFHSPLWSHFLSGALAGAYLLLDDHKQARAYLENAISPHSSMDTAAKRFCWARQAELSLAQGDPSSSLDITERLIISAPGMSSGRVITFLWKLKADALAAKGRTGEALVLMHEAINNANEFGERFLLWRLHAGLAQLYCTIGQTENARKECLTVQSLVDGLAATIADETLKNNFLQGAYGILGTSSTNLSER